MVQRWSQVSRQGTTAFFLALALVAASVYSVLWAADRNLFGFPYTPLQALLSPGSSNALAGLAEVTVGVLGVAITVVSIIVELAATRYTARITELFLRDRTNVVVLSFFVLTSLLVVWVNVTVGPDAPPRVLVVAELVLISVSVVLLLPYFAYVFDFLSPTRVVRRISENGVRAMDRAVRGGDLDAARASLTQAIEQLGDISHKAVQNQDKAIAIASVTALADLLTGALDRKARLPDGWFDARAWLRGDSDFVAFHRDVIDRLVPRRTWLTMKGLLQFQATFGETLLEMRDAGHLIVIQTRRLAVVAATMGDLEVVRLALRFVNTFSRAAINARDVRSAYNILNEYRLLAEGLIDTPAQHLVLEVADRMKYYGQLGFKVNLGFILETAAFDLCSLLEVLHARGAAEHDALLDVFLDVDREPEGDLEVQEQSLRGVRKAQIKLATYYIEQGEVELARRIHRDMSHESPIRLRGIRAELERTLEEEYWEISDRGANFDWLEPGRRARLAEFFGWFPRV
ncbi:MAG: DUF2254 domain-containing protein [Alphaproteobacteria bacterium]|nr:DUF2254 domain-containing protein [Alphaproteobacteria bacterium]